MKKFKKESWFPHRQNGENSDMKLREILWELIETVCQVLGKAVIQVAIVGVIMSVTMNEDSGVLGRRNAGAPT